MRTAREWTSDRILSALERVAQTGEPAPGAARLLDVGSDAFLRHFESEVLDGLLRSGGATCRFFEGPYGAGKTHLLDLLEDAGRERGMAVVRTTLSEALSLEDWRLVTQHVLQNVELEVDGTRVKSLPRILEAMARHGVGRHALTGAALPHPGVLRAMQLVLGGSALRGNGRSLLHRYLTGEKVTVHALRAEGITGIRQPLSTRNAELVLKTALAGLRRLGVPGILLLFDENEKTFVFSHHKPPKRVVRGANLLRDIIDSSASGGLEGTLTVFAVLQDFVQNSALAYPALGQRLHVQLSDPRASWRWPVLRIDHVTITSDRQAFLEAAITKLEQLAERCGHTSNGLPDELRDAGRDVLARHAGGEYRRYLMKRLCTIVVAKFEGDAT